MTSPQPTIERGRERPILFSGEMVRAILDGKKAQTRRVLKPQPPPQVSAICWNRGERYWLTHGTSGYDYYGPDPQPIKLPCSVGDVLWVREAWAKAWNVDRERDWPRVPHRILETSDDGTPLEALIWAATAPDWHWVDGDGFYEEECSHWKPSIHMRREHARIFMRVTDVRVERLQEITEEDAIAEGCQPERECCEGPSRDCGCLGMTRPARGVFAELWDSLNAKRGFGWDVNPWVVAYTFQKCEEPS